MNTISLDEQIKNFRPVFGDTKSLQIRALCQKRNECLEVIRKSGKSLSRVEALKKKKTKAEEHLEQVESQIRFELKNLSTISPEL